MSTHKETKTVSPRQKSFLVGKNEQKVKSLIESLGFFEGKDFIHQYPTAGYVLDFAFPVELVYIEADGKEHKHKVKADTLRDAKLKDYGWVVIRIPDEKLDSYGMSFYRNLIREVVSERLNS